MGARWRWVVAVLTVVASTLLLEGVAAAEYSEQQLLTQSDGYKNDTFGESVALSDDGNTAIVGAEDDGGTGSATVFVRSGSTWTQQQTFFK